MNDLEKIVLNHDKIINELHLALFGDGNGNVGMTKKVDEMYVVFSSAGWVSRFVLKCFAAVGCITAAIIGVYELVKRVR